MRQIEAAKSSRKVVKRDLSTTRISSTILLSPVQNSSIRQTSGLHKSIYRLIQGNTNPDAWPQKD
jgi:hypothetical protein